MFGAAWAALKAFGIWQKISGAISAAFGWAIKNPWIAASLVLAAATWWFHHDDIKYHARYAALVKADAAAQKVAAANIALARADKAKSEAAVAQFAGVTNHDYEDGVADGRDQLATYFAAKLRSATSSRSGTASSASQDHAASVPEQPSATPTVAFTQDQLKDWDADYQYGLSCQAYAQGLAKLYDGTHWPAQAQ